jgi:hypothetical protein
MKALDAPTKKIVVPNLMPKALWYFRWGAVVTVLAGLGYYAMYILRPDVILAKNDGGGANTWLILLIHLAVREYLADLARQRVGVGDVALVELEVHLQSLVGDAVQAREVELLGLVLLDITHRFLLGISAATHAARRRLPLGGARRRTHVGSAGSVLSRG